MQAVPIQAAQYHIDGGIHIALHIKFDILVIVVSISVKIQRVHSRHILCNSCASLLFLHSHKSVIFLMTQQALQHLLTFLVLQNILYQRFHHKVLVNLAIAAVADSRWMQQTVTVVEALPRVIALAAFLATVKHHELAFFMHSIEMEIGGRIRNAICLALPNLDQTLSGNKRNAKRGVHGVSQHEPDIGVFVAFVGADSLEIGNHIHFVHHRSIMHPFEPVKRRLAPRKVVQIVIAVRLLDANILAAMTHFLCFVERIPALLHDGWRKRNLVQVRYIELRVGEKQILLRVVRDTSHHVAFLHIETERSMRRDLHEVARPIRQDTEW
mmetsp:Transcript_14126/g.22036  ORF Transcript_14126/g.22036 Transcript_14126/m.22036 type:complete len:326 (-) Transcript_14126:216-1193(-)